MTLRLRGLNPRGWGRGLRALMVVLLTVSLSLPQGLRRLRSVWRDRDSDRRYFVLSLPRVAAALREPHPAVRVRVSLRGVSLDNRQIGAALRPETRQRVIDNTEALWREALFADSPDVISLVQGRLRNDGERRGRLLELQARYRFLTDALSVLRDDELAYESWQSPMYFIDARVPMETVREVLAHTSHGGSGFALRGPQGLLSLEGSGQGIASVSLTASSTRFVLRSRRDAQGCNQASQQQIREVTISRGSPDHGIIALSQALSESPWRRSELLPALGSDTSSAVHRTEEPARRAERAAQAALSHLCEPWGQISICLDGGVSYGDAIAVIMAARERSPGSCDAKGISDMADCMFPRFHLAVGRPVCPSSGWGQW